MGNLGCLMIRSILGIKVIILLNEWNYWYGFFLVYVSYIIGIRMRDEEFVF